MSGLARTVCAFGFTVSVMIVLVPAGFVIFLLSLLGLRKPMNRIIYTVAQVWARIIVILTGCRMTVRGREYIPEKEGICLVSNHVGIFDILLLLAYTGRPFGFIAKKELSWVPALNIWILLLGGLFIDRKRPRKALATIHKGVKRIKNGGGMLIFPEGTRSRGRGIGPFLPGALKLATQSDAAIVPVAITGSYEVFEKHYRVNAAPVFLSFLPPVRSGDLPPEDRKQALPGRIHSLIAAELDRHKTDE